MGMVNIKRGDIVIVNLSPTKGSEQSGVRPCVVIQNDIGNEFSPTTIIAAITSKQFNKEFPTNVNFPKQKSKLKKDSTILLNQIRTIDKNRIMKKISSLDEFLLEKVDLALKTSLHLD
jgi:mRNA interferase MazF